MRPISNLELPPTNVVAHFVLAAGPGAQPASAPARRPLRVPGSPSAWYRIFPATGRPEGLADINDISLCTSSGVSRPLQAVCTDAATPWALHMRNAHPMASDCFKHDPPSLDVSKSDPVAWKTNRRNSSSGMPLPSQINDGVWMSSQRSPSGMPLRSQRKCKAWIPS